MAGINYTDEREYAPKLTFKNNEVLDYVMLWLIFYDDTKPVFDTKQGGMNHDDTFEGTYIDAHEYARNKAGKRYTIRKA